jgi:trigger factor
MQVTELTAEGLKREYMITFGADEIESRVNGRLQRLQQNARLPGFRPGKAPVQLLKKQHGRAIRAEVLEEAVNEGTRQALEEKQLRPALRPKIDLISPGEMGDLEFRLDLEILPDVPEQDLEGLELTKLTAGIDDTKVEETLQRLAQARQKFEAPAEPRAAADGDQVVIDYEGRIDGEQFEGGTRSDETLRLGSDTTIPGFESGIVGMMPGETREIEVKFPDEYGVPHLAGKPATFKITLKEVRAPLAYELDDAWAKEMGEDSVDEVKARIRERLGAEYNNVTRMRMKRQLLDQLAERYQFPVPEGMVELEFDAIWSQLTGEMQRTGGSFGEGDQSEEALRAEYRKIAERRVRLGLVLSDIGNRNGVRVENEELQQAVLREAMRFPGDRRQFFEFVRNNQAALEQIRAPLFEDKVCDFIFAKAKVEERTVPVEELLQDEEEDDLPAPPAAASPETGPEEKPAA